MGERDETEFDETEKRRIEDSVTHRYLNYTLMHLGEVHHDMRCYKSGMKEN
jgi:hypothetical protein